MEVYILEFEYFSGVYWTHRTMTIKAINMFQLKRTFINEMNNDLIIKNNQSSLKVAIKEMWKKELPWITKETLTFPIIESRK